MITDDSLDDSMRYVDNLTDFQPLTIDYIKAYRMRLSVLSFAGWLLHGKI